MSEGKAAVTYARVSGEEQARKGYSLPDQREVLRRWCKEEGYTVIEEIADEGWSGAHLERPGLDQVRDLVQGGGVDAVVVLFRDRLARGVQAGLLAEEFRGHGTRLVALNAQVDDSPEGDLQGGLLDLFAQYERSVIRRRTQRGLVRSVKQGNVIRGPKPPYGFAFAEDNKALVIREDEMAVVRRVFSDMAAGTSAGSMIRRLEAEGVPGPSGLPRWNKKTLAHFLGGDLYRPHAAAEVEEMVEPEVAVTLDARKVYGLWYWNRRATRSWKERVGGEIVTRYAAEQRPREEWLAAPVDITDAGLSAATVDRAREMAKDRYREPSGAAGRFWQLRGIARCAECGSVLSPHTVPRKRADGSKASSFYYQCRRRFNNGPRNCDHTTSYPAAAFEETVWDAVFDLLSDPERLRRQHRQHIESMRREVRGDPDREARVLADRLQKLERRRSGYLDLAADGDMPREDLRAKLAGLEDGRRELRAALRSARNRRQSIEAAERVFQGAAAIVEHLDRVTFMCASSEDRRRIYSALRLRADVDAEGNVRLSGIFDPDIRLLDVLQDPADTTTPRPAAGKKSVNVVVSENISSRT